MIGCEYRCIKHEGSTAHHRILIKDQNIDLNICSTCLEAYFHPSEYEILEDYTQSDYKLDFFDLDNDSAEIITSGSNKEKAYEIFTKLVSNLILEENEKIDLLKVEAHKSTLEVL